MKSLAELNAIRDKAKANMNIREDNEYTTRVLVGMATCGIAAGAKPVLTALVDEIARRNLSHVTVSQTGCIGMCQYEPIVEVLEPGKEKGHLCQGNARNGRAHRQRSSRQRQPSANSRSALSPNNKEEKSMYRSHVLVCGGTGCTSSHSAEIIAEFEKEIAEKGLADEIKVIRTGCFGLCALGPIVVVYPKARSTAR